MVGTFLAMLTATDTTGVETDVEQTGSADEVAVDAAPLEGAVEADPARVEDGADEPAKVSAAADDVTSLKAEIAALKELVSLTLAARGRDAEPPANVEPAEPAEPDDPEPDVARDASGWVKWSARQETKAAVAPLREEIKALSEAIKALAPIGEERAQRSRFDAAFAEVSKVEPKLADRDFNNKVAAAIQGDPALLETMRANPSLALRLGARVVKADLDLAAYRAAEARAKQTRADRAAAAPPRGAVGNQGTAAQGVAHNADEAIARAMRKLGIQT